MSGNIPVNSRMNTQKDKQLEVQKNVFTTWINIQLSRLDRPVNQVEDLFTDLRNGIILVDLLEAMYNATIRKDEPTNMNRIHMLQNIENVIKYLRSERKMKLVNVNSCDIADGTPAIILGLIWNLILDHQLNLHRRWTQLDLDEDITDSCILPPETCSVSGPTPKQLLIERTNNILSKHSNIQIHDFGSSWRDGRAFYALLKSLQPDLMENDFFESKTTNEERLELAFKTAEDVLKMPRMLRPSDVNVDRPDEKAILTYVSELLNRHARVAFEARASLRGSQISTPEPINETCCYGDNEVFLQDNHQSTNYKIKQPKETNLEKIMEESYKSYSSTFLENVAAPHVTAFSRKSFDNASEHVVHSNVEPNEPLNNSNNLNNYREECTNENKTQSMQQNDQTINELFNMTPTHHDEENTATKQINVKSKDIMKEGGELPESNKLNYIYKSTIFKHSNIETENKELCSNIMKDSIKNIEKPFGMNKTEDDKLQIMNTTRDPNWMATLLNKLNEDEIKQNETHSEKWYETETDANKFIKDSVAGNKEQIKLNPNILTNKKEYTSENKSQFVQQKNEPINEQTYSKMHYDVENTATENKPNDMANDKEQRKNKLVDNSILNPNSVTNKEEECKTENKPNEMAGNEEKIKNQLVDNSNILTNNEKEYTSENKRQSVQQNDEIVNEQTHNMMPIHCDGENTTYKLENVKREVMMEKDAELQSNKPNDKCESTIFKLSNIETKNNELCSNKLEATTKIIEKPFGIVNYVDKAENDKLQIVDPTDDPNRIATFLTKLEENLICRNNIQNEIKLVNEKWYYSETETNEPDRNIVQKSQGSTVSTLDGYVTAQEKPFDEDEFIKNIKKDVKRNKFSKEGSIYNQRKVDNENDTNNDVENKLILEDEFIKSIQKGVEASIISNEDQRKVDNDVENKLISEDEFIKSIQKDVKTNIINKKKTICDQRKVHNEDEMDNDVENKLILEKHTEETVKKENPSNRANYQKIEADNQSYDAAAATVDADAVLTKKNEKANKEGDECCNSEDNQKNNKSEEIKYDSKETLNHNETNSTAENSNVCTNRCVSSFWYFVLTAVIVIFVSQGIKRYMKRN